MWKILVAAANYLSEKQFAPPTLLIGHSLGGAAVIFAASGNTFGIKGHCKHWCNLQSIGHVEHLLKSSLKKLKQHGKAVRELQWKGFLPLKKQFLGKHL